MNLEKNSIDWENYFQQWLMLLREHKQNEVRKVEVKIRQILNNRKLKDVDWVVDALNQMPNKDIRISFILKALKGTQMPNLLFEPLLRAAVYENDPSNNRLFIGPCLRCFGIKKVNLRLIKYLTDGSDQEKAGAVSAFYWSLGLKENDEITKKEYLALCRNINILMLNEFILNSDIKIRQRIIPQLEVNPSSYPKKLHPLLQKAIIIAKSHPDEYIRHRIEIQLGSHGPYAPIP